MRKHVKQRKGCWQHWIENLPDLGRSAFGQFYVLQRSSECCTVEGQFKDAAFLKSGKFKTKDGNRCFCIATDKI